MKKIRVLLLLTLLIVSGCKAQNTMNLTDDMKIPYGKDLSTEDGSDAFERDGDHKDTPYFTHLDFFDMKSNENLTLLPKFKTIQQSSEWSCGPATALMVLEFFGNPNGLDESDVASLRPQGLKPGATSLSEMIEIFDKLEGFTLESSQDFKTTEALEAHFTLEKIQSYLKEGLPVMIGWNDWGGHWQAIIGYDTMGTETLQDDVIIVADPYDSTDHNQDGYGVYPAERFYYNFNFYDFFEENSDENNNFMQFLVVKPQ